MEGTVIHQVKVGFSMSPALIIKWVVLSNHYEL
jgi:hypothetical protein